MRTLRRSRDRRTPRRPLAVAALAFFFFLLLAQASARPLAPLEGVPITRGGLSGGGATSGSTSPGAARRRLVGPGSAPPSCRSRCGSCSPCKPVHVPVRPGLSAPLEYYPEAWRCSCGNELFMP